MRNIGLRCIALCAAQSNGLPNIHRQSLQEANVGAARGKLARRDCCAILPVVKSGCSWICRALVTPAGHLRSRKPSPGTLGRRWRGGKSAPLEFWRIWAADVRGKALPGGPFVLEQAPEQTANALGTLFSGMSATMRGSRRPEDFRGPAMARNPASFPRTQHLRGIEPSAQIVGHRADPTGSTRPRPLDVRWPQLAWDLQSRIDPDQPHRLLGQHDLMALSELLSDQLGPRSA